MMASRPLRPLDISGDAMIKLMGRLFGVFTVVVSVWAGAAFSHHTGLDSPESYAAFFFTPIGVLFGGGIFVFCDD